MLDINNFVGSWLSAVRRGVENCVYRALHWLRTGRWIRSHVQRCISILVPCGYLAPSTRSALILCAYTIL
jgi:hypothetical protein